MKKIKKSLITKSLFITSISLVLVPYFGLQLSISLNNQITNKNEQTNFLTHTHTHTDRQKRDINDYISDNSNKFNIPPIPSSSEMESDSKWIESIKETQSNNTIKLIFTRNASLVYQQSTLVVNYLLEENNYSNKEMKNEIALFIDNDVHQDHDKFNFTNYTKLSNDYENTQFLLISNQNHFPNVTTNEEYRVFPSTSMLNTIFDFYKKKYGNNVMFDIWIPDLSLISVWGKYNSSKEWFNILQHTNHIYLTSDGNAQTFKFVESYISWLNRQDKNTEILNYRTLTKLNNIYDKSDNNPAFKAYSNSVLWDFLRTNLFTIFHITRYIDSPYYKTSLEKMYPAYTFNYDYFDLSNKLFDKNSTDKRNKFINNYEVFFKVENATINEFIYKGYENYDPNKKNIIWMGDSLIREASHVNEKRTEEIQKTFLGIAKNYPVEEYNYFFKHHPYYTAKQQEEMTNFITKKSENIKPIYLDNFPWEMFLSWDRKEQSKSKQGYTPFFSSTSNNDDIPQTQLIGIQYTSTTILSTYLFLKQNYNLTEEQAYKSINYNNFPVPGTFDIIYRGLPSINLYEEQIEINKERTKNVYNPFLEIGYIKNFYQDQLTTKEFLRINNIPSYFFTDYQHRYFFKNPITIAMITITITTIIFGCYILFSHLPKEKKNKKQK